MSEQFVAQIDATLKELDEILPDTLRKITVTESKRTKGEVHRLYRLIEVAKENRVSITRNQAINPHLIAELRDIIAVIKTWKHDPAWSWIVPALVSPSYFRHTIGLLFTATNFRESGSVIEIVKESSDAVSPDLRVKATNGEWLWVECYQPEELDGRFSDLSNDMIDKIIKKSMRKAKRQLSERISIFVLFSYGLSPESISKLFEAFSARLVRSSRLGLFGIMLQNREYFLKSQQSGFNIFTTNTFYLIRNPVYFGVMSIEMKDENPTPSKVEVLRRLQSKPHIATTKLQVIQEPEEDTAAIIESKPGGLTTLFRGEGESNLLCGNCSALLAEKAWKVSLNNIVVHCPQCHLFNYITETNFPDYLNSTVPLILVQYGRYAISTNVIMKRGARLIGIPAGLMRFLIEQRKQNKPKGDSRNLELQPNFNNEKTEMKHSNCRRLDPIGWMRYVHCFGDR